jgi:hypothetical protein
MDREGNKRFERRDGYILILDKTGFLQTLAEGGQIGRGRYLLRACRGARGAD